MLTLGASSFGTVAQDGTSLFESRHDEVARCLSKIIQPDPLRLRGIYDPWLTSRRYNRSFRRAMYRLNDELINSAKSRLAAKEIRGESAGEDREGGLLLLLGRVF